MADSITVPLGGFLNSNGYYYQLTVSYKLSDANTAITIPNSIIQRIEIYSKLNKLDIDATIDLIDISGQISKIFKQKFVFFEIDVQRYKVADVGSNFNLTNSETKFEFDYQFRHDFILDKFQILNRGEGNAYTYRFKLISAHSVKLNSIIRYSNWGLDITDHKNDNETDIIGILQNCANSCGVSIKTFSDPFADKDTRLSNVRLQYCTSANDNFYSIFDYLMKRLYFYPDKKIESLWFISAVGDPFYELFLTDINDKTTITFDSRPLIISAWDTGVESLVADYINFAVVNKLNVKDVIQSLYPVNRWDYSLLENKLKPSNVTSEDIINYSNTSYLKGANAGEVGPSDIYLTNTKGLDQFTDYVNAGRVATYTPYNSTRSFGYSNTMPSIYDEQMKYLLEKNAIVVNAQGDLKRIPGSAIFINKQNKSLTSDDPSNISVQNLKEIYAEYSGEWIIESVRSIISPMTNNMQFDFFRQNLVMFRNAVLTNNSNKKQ
jgi:hypothetical protein